jgi:hypothetical protein
LSCRQYLSNSYYELTNGDLFVNNPSMTTTPTLVQLTRGLAIAEQIAALEAEIAAIFNGSTPASPAKATPTKKATPASGKGNRGKRSPETIAKMKAAQQARWAKIKAPAAAKAEIPAKKKSKMSAEGRARIVAAQKARWAKIKGTKAPAASKAPAKSKAETPVKKRAMSPEVKAKLAAAMKARWAAAKAGKGPAPTSKKK